MGVAWVLFGGKIMERWRNVWRNGLAPQLTPMGLEALRQGLLRDDGNLAQGITTSPPCLDVFAEAPIEAACALGYCGWKGEGQDTVAALTAYYENLCTTADTLLGEPGICRFFLNWFDETPRGEMRKQLLAEVGRELMQRAASAA